MPPYQGMPGPTRYSTVVGLMESTSSRKWNLFLREGPYWNYLVHFIRDKGIFHGRQDRVEEAVMNACEKISKFMVAKKYKYPEAGKGYFRGFLKVVAFRVALDLYRDIRRQERTPVPTDAELEDDRIQADLQKANDKRRKELEKEATAEAGLNTEIVAVSGRDLDVYDMSAGLDRRIEPAATPKKATGRKMHSLTRLDNDPFLDDEMPSNYDPAALFAFEVQTTQEDLAWIRRLQVHVIYIALGYVLTNDRVTVDRRELLRLRYGLDMTPAEIYALPRFASKSRSALDAAMSHATDELRKEAATWWDLVAPSGTDFADETVLRFWRELSRRKGAARLANDLQDKAIGRVGRIE